MFAFVKKLFGLPTEAESAAAKAAPAVAEVGQVAVKASRTKDGKGKFIADDPRTTHNEAWTTGKSPAKKPAVKKPTTKKPATKKPATKKPAADTPKQ
jgi:hypothetical protein